MSKFTVGSFEFDTDTIPEVNRAPLMRRTISHILHNEVAAKVGAWKGKEENANASESAIAAFTLDCQKAAVDKIMNGVLGMREAGGAAVDPLEAEIARQVKAEVVQVLRAQKAKFPKDGETVTFANGVTRTGDQMLENWLNGTDKAGMFGPKGGVNKPRIVANAEKAIAAKARQAKRVAQAASEAPSLGDLL